MVQKELTAALEDDFNTPQALAAVFGCIKKLQPGVWSLSPVSAQQISTALLEIVEMFGLVLYSASIPKHITELVKTREHFRRRKDFVESDRLRKQISSLGYSIEDAPGGPFLWSDAYREPTHNA